MHTTLNEVLKHPRIWRGDGFGGDGFAPASPEVIEAGHPALQAALPGGGWPRAAITELIPCRTGCGELRLLLPALARLTRRGQRVLLLAPPHIPYAPAWQAAGVDMRLLTWVATEHESDTQWAMEQALREPACGAVLGWFSTPLSDRNVRRLQLAAQRGGTAGFVLRQGLPVATASAVTLRLALEPLATGLNIRVLKRRGSPLDRPVFIPHDAAPPPLPGHPHHAVADHSSAPPRPAPWPYPVAA